MWERTSASFDLKTNCRDRTIICPTSLLFQAFPQEERTMRTIEELLLDLVWGSGPVRHKGWTMVTTEVGCSDLPSREPDARNAVQPPATAPLDALWCSL